MQRLLGSAASFNWNSTAARNDRLRRSEPIFGTVHNCYSDSWTFIENHSDFIGNLQLLHSRHKVNPSRLQSKTPAVQICMNGLRCS